MKQHLQQPNFHTFIKNYKKHSVQQEHNISGFSPAQSAFNESNLKSHILAGTDPLKFVNCTSKVCSLGNNPNELGIVPVIMFWFKYIFNKVEENPIESGIVPDN